MALLLFLVLLPFGGKQAGALHFPSVFVANSGASRPRFLNLISFLFGAVCVGQFLFFSASRLCFRAASGRGKEVVCSAIQDLGALRFSSHAPHSLSPFSSLASLSLSAKAPAFVSACSDRLIFGSSLVSRNEEYTGGRRPRVFAEKLCGCVCTF